MPRMCICVFLLHRGYFICKSFSWHCRRGTSVDSLTKHDTELEFSVWRTQRVFVCLRNIAYACVCVFIPLSYILLCCCYPGRHPVHGSKHTCRNHPALACRWGQTPYIPNSHNSHTYKCDCSVSACQKGDSPWRDRILLQLVSHVH